MIAHAHQNGASTLCADSITQMLTQPSPMLDAVTVPILSDSMEHQALTHNHGARTAGLYLIQM